MLDCLKDGPVTTGGLCERFDDMDRCTVMQHLKVLEGAGLVDSFSPEGSDERNLTFRLTFRHAERTLKDAEVDKVREKVAQSLIKNLGVRI